MKIKLILAILVLNSNCVFSQINWKLERAKIAQNLGSQTNSIKRTANSGLVSGDGFRSIAKHVFDETNIAFNPVNVERGDIVFVKHDFLDLFFNCLHRKIRYQYILITHNSSSAMPGIYKKFLDQPKIIAWFGINPDINHPKFINIPLGFENEHWSAGKDHKIIQEVADLQIDKQYLLLMNFNVNTNLSEREPVLKRFESENYCYYPGVRKPFREYLLDLKKSKFCLSPFGSGKDCLRVWETILMGCIPIVKTSNLDSLYKYFPVLIVDSWDMISQEFLDRKFIELSAKKINYNLLTLNYWKDFIYSIIQ